MSVQERLDELSPYVTTIRYGKIPIIETAFPKSWGVREHDKIAVKVVEGDSKLITECIIYSELEDISIDDVLEYVAETIKINRERENKTALLKAKVEELKEVFNSNTLQRLEDLYFAFTDEVEDELELELELTPKEESKLPLGLTQEDIDDNEKLRKEEEDLTTKPATKPATKSATQKVKPSEKQPRYKKAPNKPKVELPPRKPVAPVLEEFGAPSCNCGQGQSCPECTDF